MAGNPLIHRPTGPVNGSYIVSERGRAAADVALVTGGSRGVGRALARGLGAAGFAVAIVARSEADLMDTHHLLRTEGVSAMACSADVTDLVAVTSSVAKVEEGLGPISMLVNNAGSSLAVGPMWSVEPGDWWTDVNTCLGGAFNFCRCVIPRMIDRQRGRILNVSSYAATHATPYQSAYGCAKAAISQLTESLAEALRPEGIQAFAVTPGFVRTDLTQRLAGSPEGRRWLPETVQREGTDISLFVRLVTSIALGQADVLSGRFLHALDDLGELTSRIRDIERTELYALRLRRLTGR